MKEYNWQIVLFVWPLLAFAFWLIFSHKPYETERQFSQYIAVVLFPVLFFLFPIHYYLHRNSLRWYRKQWLIMSWSQLMKQLIELPKTKR